MKKIGVILIYFRLLLLKKVSCDLPTCNRIPLGTKIEPLPPDNRFELEIEGHADQYIPEKEYRVRLFSRDNSSTFIAFTIAAREATIHNEKNPRRPISLKQGKIYTESPDGVNSQECDNTVMQADVTPKKEVIWLTPPKGNGCVTLYALVAIKDGVWYKYDGPLIKRVCEDLRQKVDLPPAHNDNCNVCEEARYQLTLKNLWSHNTHSLYYPENANARYGDLVGAVHSAKDILWKYGGHATLGLQMLAEQGNTTTVEQEIQDKFGREVRSIIKAKGMPAELDATTTALLRVGRDHHLVSFVVSILPSPDWFLGVANLELCEAIGDGQWASEVILNLYPLDAGTDSGLDFESPNDQTSPKQPIGRATFKLARDKEVKAFARLEVKLVRTYIQQDCVESSQNTTTENYDSELESVEDTVEPPDSSTDDGDIPESTEECDVSEWEDWLPCTGDCVEGKLVGFQTRIRYLVVNGVTIGKYDANIPSQNEKATKNIRTDVSWIYKNAKDNNNINTDITTNSKPTHGRQIIPKDCDEKVLNEMQECTEDECPENEIQNITGLLLYLIKYNV